MEHPLKEEHPRRLEEVPPEVLSAWLDDMTLTRTIEVFDAGWVMDAEPIARRRARVPLDPEVLT